MIVDDTTGTKVECSGRERRRRDDHTPSVDHQPRRDAPRRSSPTRTAPPTPAASTTTRSPPTWTGVDATSGIASCTSTPYSGPDGTGISLTGTCKDKAGNVSAPVPFVFNYDATPPALTDVTATPDDAGARLAWQAVGGGEGDGHAQSRGRACGAEPTSSTTARATGSPTPG